MDSSRRIILWISDQMPGAGGGELFLAECFWGAGPKLYHFPIYYGGNFARDFCVKLAMSEILEGMMSRTAESVRSWTEAI